MGSMLETNCLAVPSCKAKGGGQTYTIMRSVNDWHSVQQLHIQDMRDMSPICHLCHYNVNRNNCEQEAQLLPTVFQSSL